MGYSIRYGNETNKKLSMKTKGRIKKKYIVMASALCVLLIMLMIQPVRNRIINFFFPGDTEVTRRALKDLTTDLQNGAPIGDAVTAFCLEILRNA